GDMTKVTDTQELMPKVNSKTDAELFSDLDATVGWAKSQGGDGNRLGTMGFCRGAALLSHLSERRATPWLASNKLKEKSSARASKRSMTRSCARDRAASLAGRSRCGFTVRTSPSPPMH
ncbi:MAG TPA: dienelactone hydrolase family protein, partial [Xanthobacteraceae bacterium]|nr:dienelactone hydrolase family protein [Xanthobacteraceae bacterium]